MRIVFLGTGEFGGPSLRALVAAGQPPVLVVSQPDRPAGRNRRPAPPPLAGIAHELALPLFQPERINRPEALGRLREARPDVAVVVAYGQLLKPAVLAVPRLGCVNVHGSLLPRHRGASPIAASILAGDVTTGVTIMLLDAGLDTGPVLLRAALPIGVEETAGELHDRLAARGAPLLLEALEGLAAGRLRPEPQDSAQATTCGLLRKEDGAIDWARPAGELARRIRAFTPWPGAFTVATVRGSPLRLLIERAREVSGGTGRPGEVLEAASSRLVVAAGTGALQITVVKPEGKRAQDSAAFLRGYPLRPGDVLGREG